MKWSARSQVLWGWYRPFLKERDAHGDNERDKNH